MAASFIARHAYSAVSTRATNAIRGDEKTNDPEEAGGVKWTDYNYPPLIKVMHFSPWTDDIPLVCKRTAAVVHFAFRLTLFSSFLNVLSTIGLDIANDTDGTNIILAILQAIIVSGASFFAFYHHYRGIAGEIKRSSMIFLITEGILSIFFCVFIFANYSNVHGFSSIGSHSGSALYDIFAIIEASFWSLTLLIALTGIWRVWRYPGHTIARRREQPATASKFKMKTAGRAADLVAR